MAKPSTPHVIIFPFMAQGHTLPLLDISKALACRGLEITIITTPSNAPFILSKTSTFPTISLSIIPFPQVKELPQGCENTLDLPSIDLIVPFIRATKNLKKPFEDILNEMSQNGCPPICVISDFFLSWTLDSCRTFRIPRVVSHGMGVLPMNIFKTLGLQPSSITSLSDFDVIKLPNLKIPFLLNKADLPEPFQYDPNEHPFSSIMAEVEEADVNSWGVIINSFEELEGEYVATLESFYCNQAKAWFVGPLLHYDHVEGDGVSNTESHNKKLQYFSYIKWLDDQAVSGAMIYVSFGTQTHLSDVQMDEIAFGLEMVGQPFIWVVRSKSWVPPEGWKDRTKDRGLVVRDWVDQRSILSHPAIGGFLSHCGWNSVLESLSIGVPLLAWPMGAEQFLNAKYLEMGLGIGIKVPDSRVEGEKIITLDRSVICNEITKLMRGEKGRMAREKVQNLEKMARQAVEKGGSSYKRLDQLIDSLINKKD